MMPSKDEARDLGDASLSQKCQRLPENHQMAGETHKTGPASQPSEETNPANIIFDF